MTMNDTWGYKKNDDHWKSAATLVHNLIDCASKGGNYLLNVGPTGEGLIPDASLARLKVVGDWMSANSHAIYDTTASPFAKPLPWGRCTTKVSGTTTTLYLHVFDWPADGELLVPGLKNQVAAVWLLAREKSLRAETTEDGLVIHTPPKAPDAISTTIAVRIKEPLRLEPFSLAQRPDGSLALAAVDAQLHGTEFRYESGGILDDIGYWTDARDWADWDCKIRAPGKFEISAVIAAPVSGSFDIVVGKNKLRCAAPVTASYVDFKTVTLGVLEIPATGRFTLAMHPVADAWQPMNLKSIRIKPIPTDP